MKWINAAITVSVLTLVAGNVMAASGDAEVAEFQKSARQASRILTNHPELVGTAMDLRNLGRLENEAMVLSMDSGLSEMPQVNPSDEGSANNELKLKTYFSLMAVARSANRDMPTILIMTEHDALLENLAQAPFFIMLLVENKVNPRAVTKIRLQGAYANWLYVGMLPVQEDVRLNIFFQSLKLAE